VESVNERGTGQGGLGVCVVLAALLIACALVTKSIVATLAGSVLCALLAIELDRSGGLIGVRLVRLASRLVPRRVRNDYADEWTDHVLSAGEAGMRPVMPQRRSPR